MSTRPSPTPPAATARPKNAASSLAAAHASSSSSSSAAQQQRPASMSPGARPARGSTPSKAGAAEGDKPVRAASKDSLKQKMPRKVEETPKPSRAEEVRMELQQWKKECFADLCVQQLKALKADFDGLRSHLTCKICDRLFYQPYTIACGHTYCYSVSPGKLSLRIDHADSPKCLCTWFVPNKARKTCPDCRTVVTQVPAPAYVVSCMST